ncbi:hypothetical protein LTR08_001615 [Meristemomyces frigidus]|nr:hypothetical protein LTR08_001615 [Meristemomyces frigidus]
MNQQRALSSPDYMDSNVFVRMTDQASAVLGDFLYLDGGLMLWDSDSGVNNILNDTLSLPLSTSWNNATVSFSRVSRGVYPDQPSLSYENLWVSNDSSSFYVFGGEMQGYIGGTGPVQPMLWQFKADNSGGGTWSKAGMAQDSVYDSLSAPTHALATSGNGLGFALGGASNCQTYSSPHLCAGEQTPLPGLVMFNMSSNSFSNISASGKNGYSTYGTAYGGGAQLAPTFGAEGVALFFGGQTSGPTQIDGSSPAISLTQIAVFDPHSQTWYTQQASGNDIPEARVFFCSVGVQGDNGTYEIFMYGGVPDGWDVGATTNATANSMDEIYVLSLPSFVWFKADYPALNNRYAHTCQVVGKRQLLTFGGVDWAQVNNALGESNQSDPFTRGLGIFDMSEMTWSDSYNATAATYQTPDVIKSYIRANGATPSSWSDPALAQIFTMDSTTAISQSASISGGAIAGIVIGAVAALTIVALLSWFLIRRRKRNAQRNSNQLLSPLPEYHHAPEKKAAQAVYELDSRSRLNELPSSRLDPVELEGYNQPADNGGDNQATSGLRSSSVERKRLMSL